MNGDSTNPAHVMRAFEILDAVQPRLDQTIDISVLRRIDDAAERMRQADTDVQQRRRVYCTITESYDHEAPD